MEHMNGSLSKALADCTSFIVPWSVDDDFVTAMNEKWMNEGGGSVDHSFDYVVDVSCPTMGLEWPVFINNIARLLKPGEFLVQLWGGVREITGFVDLAAAQGLSRVEPAKSISEELTPKWWIKTDEDIGGKADIEEDLEIAMTDIGKDDIETKGKKKKIEKRKKRRRKHNSKKETQI